MKLQVISDTHTYDYDIHPEADVIVHAGDFSNNLRGCLDFVDICKSKNKEYVFCLGNHDYYGSVLNDVIAYMKSHHLNFLHWDNSIEINGYTFVGGTLFSNFRENTYPFEEQGQVAYNKHFAQHGIYDFISIRSNVNTFITADEYTTMFNKTLNNINKYKNQENVIVVTHFPPSVACMDPQYEGSPLNPYFINSVDVKGFKHWISGHTHTAVDTVEDGCRLVINPLGYPLEHGVNGYRPNLIVEV